jgi:hypothetical protein
VPRGTPPRQCLWEGCDNLRTSTQIYCAGHWAEYLRGYHEHKTEESFTEGVATCMLWLREQVGDRMLTGKQAAQLLARIGQQETPERKQRRQLIESMKAGS